MKYLFLFLTVGLSSLAFAVKPGTYSTYKFPTTAGQELISIGTQWVEADDGAFVFAAYQFIFENNSDGYIGTKLRGPDRQVVFSIWDAADNAITALPAAVSCQRFGGEGTGAQCGVPYQFQFGNTYRLTVKKVSSEADGDRWRGTVVDSATSEETVIGEILLKRYNAVTGYGLVTPKQALAWIEFFKRPDTCENQPHVKVNWIGPYLADGNSASESIATYTACPNNNITSQAKPISSHEAGGDTEMVTPRGEDVWR